MPGSNTLTFTDSNFETDVLNSEVPVLVDFWAEWCPPCRAVGPAVDFLADEYAGKAKVGKLSIDEYGAVATIYNVRSIPTLLVFKGGTVVDQVLGAVPRADLARMLDRHL